MDLSDRRWFGLLSASLLANLTLLVKFDGAHDFNQKVKLMNNVLEVDMTPGRVNSCPLG